MQQLLLSVMLSPLPPGASEADSVLGLALLALLANAGKRHMLSCCHAVLCALCMLAACGHLQLAAGSGLPSSLPCPILCPSTYLAALFSTAVYPCRLPGAPAVHHAGASVLRGQCGRTGARALPTRRADEVGPG